MTATTRSTLITLAALATITATAAAGTPAGAATTGTAGSSASAGVVTAHGQLSDLQPATTSPLDDARAVLVMVSHPGQSLVILQVSGVDRSAAGRRFGAHLHVGPCMPGDGAAAGPHYNADVVAGRVPPRVNASTEVWLDFTVTPGGTGTAITQVPFVALPGQRAIVIHQEPTDDHGAAGPRLACLPVSW